MKLLAGLLLLAIMAPLPAVAGSSTGQLQVSATVVSDCVVTAPATVNFGSYNPLTQGSGSPLDFAGSALSITCTRGSTSVKIGLDSGAFASGSSRNMESDQGTGTIQYQIYSDQQYATVWDETNTVAYLPQDFALATIPLYGQIPGGQTPAPGHYSDTLMALVSF